MEFKRRLKNWVVINPVASYAFNTFRNTRLYRHLVIHRVNKINADLRRSKNYNISIETTNSCNAECSFCPYTIMERKKKVMDDATFDLLVQRLKDEGIQPYAFSLNGTGEPLIDKKIFSRIRRLKQNSPKRSRSSIRIFISRPMPSSTKSSPRGLMKLTSASTGSPRRNMRK